MTTFNPEPHRLSGEDSPIFHAFLFLLVGLLGTAIAVYYTNQYLTSTMPAAPEVTEPRVGSGFAMVPTASPTPNNPRATSRNPVLPTLALAATPLPSPVIRVCSLPFVFQFAAGAIVPQIPDATLAGITTLQHWLMVHPDAQVFVEGHTDDTGPNLANLRLSYQRAEQVATMLVHAGIDKARLRIRAVGEGELLPDVQASSALNRRVVMRILAADNCP